MTTGEAVGGEPEAGSMKVREVPFFGLDRQYARYRETFLGIIDEVLSTGQVLQGDPVRELESDLCALTDRSHAVAVGSATDGLAFALSALGVGTGDEVLVTSFSFIASASPIVRVGATPRFVDIDPDSYMMDLEDLERNVTERTKAIIAVHLYGRSLAMEQLEEFAERRGLHIIEDAAQGLGTRYRNRRVGSMGAVSCVSFDPTKVIGSFSSAGAVMTNDPEIARLVAMQRYHGRDPDTREYEILGYNSQLSSEMAAVLRFKLSMLEEWEGQRDGIAQIYMEGLRDLQPALTLPQLANDSTHNWHKFVVRSSNRDALKASLAANGVQTMVHYPTALCDTPLFAGIGAVRDVPNARRACETVLSLPIYAEMSREEAEYVVRRIREFHNT